MNSDFWFPGDVVGCGSDGYFGVGSEAVDREGGVVDRCHADRQPWPSGVVAVFVPPAVFQEVQAVFDSPVLADVAQEVGSGDLSGIEAAHEVARVMQQDLAILSEQFTINAQRNAATGQVERFTDVLRVI
ncbi:MAG: hypothetical protein RJP95_01405 [Pirellulales bacterium]